MSKPVECAKGDPASVAAQEDEDQEFEIIGNEEIPESTTESRYHSFLSSKIVFLNIYLFFSGTKYVY